MHFSQYGSCSIGLALGRVRDRSIALGIACLRSSFGAMSKLQKHQGPVPLASDDRLGAAMQRYSDLLVDRSCLFNFGEYSNGQQHAQATHGDSILNPMRLFAR